MPQLSGKRPTTKVCRGAGGTLEMYACVAIPVCITSHNTTSTQCTSSAADAAAKLEAATARREEAEAARAAADTAAEEATAAAESATAAAAAAKAAREKADQQVGVDAMHPPNLDKLRVEIFFPNVVSQRLSYHQRRPKPPPC